MIRVLELFGGIGACTQAFKRLKIPFEVVDYVEIDKYATQSYNAMNGTNFEPQDIRNWNKDIEVDFIMHGSPCQDFSIAGKQAGGDEGTGTRSSLMYETLRIVNKLKPKYVLWENVKNLLSEEHKHNFDRYVDIMSEGGYCSYYEVLNAKDYGIPQNRERVFCLSIRRDINEGFIFPPKEWLKLKLKDLLEENVDEKYFLSDKTIEFFTRNEQEQREKGNGFRFGVSDGDVIANAVTTRAGGRMDDNYIKSEDKRLKQIIENTNFEKGKPLNLDLYNQSTSEISQTLLDPKHNSQRLFDGLRIRKLTPKECWRLMGFDDECIDKAKASGVSDAQLYKQAGNSIVVDVLIKILDELFIQKRDIQFIEQIKLW